MSDPILSALEEAKEKAERYGLSFYVSGYYMHVMDGGKRSWYSDEWSHGCSSDSAREATEEEIILWAALP